MASTITFFFVAFLFLGSFAISTLGNCNFRKKCCSKDFMPASCWGSCSRMSWMKRCHPERTCGGCSRCSSMFSSSTSSSKSENMDDEWNDDEVEKLNTLLASQVLLSNVYANAANSTASKNVSNFARAAEDVQGLSPAIFSEFRDASEAQISSIRNLLKTRAREPLSMDVTTTVLSGVVNKAFSNSLQPLFDASENLLNTLLAIQAYPRLASSIAKGILPQLDNSQATRLVSKMLPSVVGQDATIRTLLFMKKNTLVSPYNQTVSNFVNRISAFNQEKSGTTVLYKDQGYSEFNFLGVDTFGRVMTEALFYELLESLGIARFHYHASRA